MINLLPPAEKDAIAYARYNTQLRRWISGGLVGLVGVILLVMAGQMYLNQNADDYRSANKARQERLVKDKQQETLAQVKNIQTSFKLVVDVLSREVLFSKLLPQVGAIMPTGTVLENLSLNTEGEVTAFDITAKADNYQSASQIQANLEDPANKLFDKADLIDITCTSPKEPTPYPCSVQARVQPSKENQFLLLNKEAR